MKKILIVRGNEFKVYDHEIGRNEDIFEDVYKKAMEQYKLLEQYAERMEEGKKEGNQRKAEYLNNVIAFCGERGQGKSTAMQHFVRELEQDEDSREGRGHGREILQAIDPTAMEMAHDIVDIIISQLFERFRRNRSEDEGLNMKISEAFQKVHRSMSVLKNAQTFIERKYAYNGSLQNLSDITDSMELRADIIRLIWKYLEYRNKKMLVIPIDDLDLNLKDVYRVAEQLRKYFMIPRTVIVMAVNTDQLALCVERELLENMKPLDGSLRWNIWQEARNMSSRYMEKLIPFPRRIRLPDIHAIAEDGKNATEIIYRDSQGGNLFDSETLGIEKGILNLIFKKTGLVYVAKANEVHPIVPFTLRELVNLITLLGDMGEDQAENLEAFEQYFCHVWLDNNLSDETAAVVRKIAGTQINDLHNDAFLLLYRMWREKEDSGESESAVSGPLQSSVEKMYQAMREGKGRPDNGDLMNCLRLLQLGNQSDLSRLTMAVSTVCSVRMLKLKTAGQGETLYDLAGENLFGEFRLIRGDAYKNSMVTERMRFEYMVKPFLDSMCKKPVKTLSVSGIRRTCEEDELARLLMFMGTFSIFRGADGLARELVSNNYQVAERAEFNISQLFRSGLSWVRMKEKISLEKWKLEESELENIYLKAYSQDTFRGIVCNMEEMMRLASYLQENRDISDSAEEKDYYIHFLESVKKFLREIQTYLPSLDTLEDEDIMEDGKAIAILKQCSFRASDLPLCRMNTRFSRLLLNLQQMDRYISSHPGITESDRYQEIEAELSSLRIRAEEHGETETIGREITDRYLDLRKELIAAGEENGY